MQILTSTEGWRFAVTLILLLLSLIYVRGWRRLRVIQPPLATRTRLLLFVVSLVAVAVVMISPLESWSHYLLVARSVQKILLCMIAAPLFWLACPFHCSLWGLPAKWRRGVTRLLHRGSATGRLLRRATQPGLAWLLFVSVFLSWHDPTFVNYIMPHPGWHRAALSVLFGAALLFWWHIVETGPRIHGKYPDWVRFACLIGVEIPNIASGLTIGFKTVPLYTYYATINAPFNHPLPLSMLDDQMLSGGLIWVFGSFAYFSSAVLVLNKIFSENNGNSAQPMPNWDADDRMIAPGLEHRVIENRWRQLEKPRE